MGIARYDRGGGASARDRRRLARAPRLPRHAGGRGRGRTARRPALGFANALLATWRTTQPRAVLVCLDARAPSYRHELLPGYQGKRDPFAGDLVEQLDRLAGPDRGVRLRGREGAALRGGRPARDRGDARGGARRRRARRLRGSRHVPARLRRDRGAPPAPARRARARRSSRRARALRDRARAGYRSDRAARRSLGQHPRRAAASARRRPPTCCGATAISRA